jgi:hypothetical protein
MSKQPDAPIDITGLATELDKLTLAIQNEKHRIQTAIGHSKIALSAQVQAAKEEWNRLKAIAETDGETVLKTVQSDFQSLKSEFESATKPKGGS